MTSNSQARKRIVVLRPLGLGDFLTGVPALRAIRDAYLDADITLAAPAVLEPIVALSDTVGRVTDTAPLTPLHQSLHGADIAIDLHGRGPESTRVLLATAPRRFIGFAAPAVHATSGLPRWRREEHEVSRWCRLLTECGIPADPDPSRLRLRRPDGDPPTLAPGSPFLISGYVIVHPGAAARARQWPPKRWAAVARVLRAEGHQVIITGSRPERPLAAEIAERAGLPEQSVDAGQTGLRGLAALTADARLVLSGDTGMAHLAAAYARPAVTLAGPVPPRLWGPPRRPWHEVLWAGRTGDPHGTTPDEGLLEIGVDDVLTASRHALAAPAPQPAAFPRQ